MRKLLVVAALVFAFLPASACAGTTPVLTASGLTLHWTGTASLYVLERQPGPSFLEVSGHEYKPAADPGHTDSFRVRPKASPNRWSNVVMLPFPAEEPPPKEEPPKEEPPPPTNQLGRVRVAPDTAEWGAFETSTWATWVTQHIAYLRLYPGTGGAWLHLGVPTESYRDWPASWEGAYAPLTPERRSAFVSQKSAADKAAGYGGNFLDDLNGWSSLSYRDQQQDKLSLEPEAAEEGRLTTAVRALWGPSGVIDCNSQLFDVLAAIRAHTAPVEEDLNACSVQTKEFGVGPTAGINSASTWASFLEWVDVVHAHHAQVRMTGSIPVTEASFELNEATYYLITQDVSSLHGDLLWLSKQLPATSCNTTPVEHGWYCGLNTDLGEALSSRELLSSGVWTRRFTAGVVYVNEPGNSTQTFTAPEGMHNLQGQPVSSVTLAGDSGLVLTH